MNYYKRYLVSLWWAYCLRRSERRSVYASLIWAHEFASFTPKVAVTYYESFSDFVEH